MEARAGRDALFARWEWLSPASVVSEGLARAAGHDGARHQRFEAELSAHHAVLRGFLHTRLQQAALRDETSACKQTCREGWGFDDFGAVPRFVSSAALTQPTPSSSVALWLWAALLLVAAGWRAAKTAPS